MYFSRVSYNTKPRKVFAFKAWSEIWGNNFVFGKISFPIEVLNEENKKYLKKKLNMNSFNHPPPPKIEDFILLLAKITVIV